MMRLNKLFPLLLPLFLAGCSFAPHYQRPQMELPASWTPGSAAEKETLSLTWWKSFNDPVLTGLIEEALVKNRDIAAAEARVNQARAMAGLSRANIFPLASAGGEAQSGAIDGKRVTGPFYSSYTYHIAAATISWEIDLWGKLRNANAAARARLLASEAAYRGVRLAVAGQTAKAYFGLLTLDAQLATARETLRSRNEKLKIHETQFREGLIPELVLKQAHAELEAARTIVLKLDQARESTEGALAALLGRQPKEVLTGIQKRGRKLEEIPASPILPSDLPSQLLERRPDIVAAEQQLIAANANIGTARAAWLPSLSLSAALGVADLYDLSRLFRSENRFTTYGGSVGMPIFDFGRILSTVRASEAAKEEMAANYEKTVLEAFADVRAALAEQAQAAAIVASAERMADDCRETLRMATTRYEEGYSSYLEVLDAERALFSAELGLAEAQNNRLNSAVHLCMALGGGW
ncbi:MAG: efflux transporter outer membrane subunit, partial [Desulfovibrionaceae bacterium]|nr:efflux transporter outer membrane subunit [Desulfovibrionaceae bacterium]